MSSKRSAWVGLVVAALGLALALFEPALADWLRSRTGQGYSWMADFSTVAISLLIGSLLGVTGLVLGIRANPKSAAAIAAICVGTVAATAILWGWVWVVLFSFWILGPSTELP